jgi:hypothetical protein
MPLKTPKSLKTMCMDKIFDMCERVNHPVELFLCETVRHEVPNTLFVEFVEHLCGTGRSFLYCWRPKCIKTFVEKLCQTLDRVSKKSREDLLSLEDN